MLRVAVVGAGPAGIYAAEALAAQPDTSVDVIDRLPCPFGLVRYGVAPDHPKLKSICNSLQRTLDDERVRFIGNVDVGTDVSVEELRHFYDAVIVASGAATDRHLDIPGESLPGSFSSTEFVSWYDGHPDAPIDQFTLQAHRVVVVGVGNVAIDVVRILAKSPAELRATDICEHALRVLERSAVEDIYIVGRRGPAQARFTTKELRELGELSNADVLVDPDDLELDPVQQGLVAEDSNARRNVEVLREWSTRPVAGRSRRIHLCFRRRPVEILGADRVTGVRLEQTRIDDAGRPAGSGEWSTIDAEMVLRAVGYLARPVPGLPFDPAAGVVPHRGGRVVRDGMPVPGVYVAGWIKRGPTGLIGTNRRDAKETVASLLEDAPTLPRAEQRDPDALQRLLTGRGVTVVRSQGWRAIDLAEIALGRAQGRERTKIADRGQLLATAASATG